MRAAIVCAVSIACALGAAAPSRAQTRRPAFEDHRIEVAVGAGLWSGSDMGSADANLRANSLQTQPYRLFALDAALARSTVVDVRAAYRLFRGVAVEARFGLNHPELRAALSSDAEGAAPLTAVERLDQYIVDGGIVFTIDRLRVGRLAPFVAGGAGYVRQLHEGQTVVEEGRIYYAGGGATYWLGTRDRGPLKSIGVRADARVNFIDGGVSIDSRVHRHASIAGSVIVGF